MSCLVRSRRSCGCPGASTQRSPGRGLPPGEVFGDHVADRAASVHRVQSSGRGEKTKPHLCMLHSESCGQVVLTTSRFVAPLPRVKNCALAVITYEPGTATDPRAAYRRGPWGSPLNSGLGLVVCAGPWYVRPPGAPAPPTDPGSAQSGMLSRSRLATDAHGGGKVPSLNQAANRVVGLAKPGADTRPSSGSRAGRAATPARRCFWRR